MDKMVVKGGRQLNGEVFASGAKNSALPILFSSLLAEGRHVFHNVPDLKDIESSILLLEGFNCEVCRDGQTIIVNVSTPQSLEAHYDIVRKMRASILCLGPLLARYGEARVSLPGGCAIGTRPINLHLEGLKALGAEIEMHSGYVQARAAKGLQGAPVLFESPTVGGTENIMMAATLARGETIIENAAKEPEIVDLANYLNKMGAHIDGAGSSTVRIEGSNKLRPAEHEIIPDRIETGTLVIAGAITGGNVTVRHCVPEHIEGLVFKLRECGFCVNVESDAVVVHENSQWRAADITTAPYPAFPTDLQAQYMALMTQAEGVAVITETVFENRFMHVQELVRLNADIVAKGHVAVVRGTKGQMQGAPVMATDLRASACLVLAGLVAGGETTINRIYHLDRGYDGLEFKLQNLGAQIKRAK